MTLPPEDRLAIAETIALHGHLFDEGQMDRLDELFTADVVYDLSDFGQEPTHGIAAIRASALALGERNPVGHHVTNVVITPVDGDTASVRSKGLGLSSDGTCGSVTYVDTVRRERNGWRISHRQIFARRTPLNGPAAGSEPSR
jgi:SnoaL-like domain